MKARVNLTEKDRKAICLMLDLKQWTQKQIAERYNVAPSTINKLYKEHCDRPGVNDENDGREEAKKHLGVEASPITFIPQEDNPKIQDIATVKNILDVDEVRLVNKTLMQENEDLRNTTIDKEEVEGWLKTLRKEKKELRKLLDTSKQYREADKLHIKALEEEISVQNNIIIAFNKTYVENGNMQNNVEKCKSDNVEHPSHYNKIGIECIDVVEHFNFNRGNAMKYIWRAGEKDKAREIEDLKKAKFYINREIENLEK